MCQLRGSYFGLHVDHPRSFEANFELRVDEALVGPGLALRRGTCLGARRHWRRRDPFGRSCTAECCAGNLWAVQGDAPKGCTLGECAVAMGVDQDHMDYSGLTGAAPPAYGEYVFGQAAYEGGGAPFWPEGYHLRRLPGQPRAQSAPDEPLAARGRWGVAQPGGGVSQCAG